MQTIKMFFEQIPMNLLIAGLAIAIIFAMIVYLLMILVFSYKQRKQAVGVHLPKIDSHGAEAFTSPEFKEPKQFSVELVDLNEDAPQNSKPKDDKQFLTALSLETKRLISDNNKNVIMPKIDNQNKLDNKGMDI